ncbi:hypothetical protein CSAL01_13661 [Colletotrichum salicis]|uniref:Uncharacterized protein n=1 Tax=Colletotrichum salicis TaxID=1209931 RepID=A0A135RY38_9PEZI|nr:hypothetical protein CSAL01_13661 [Colletotrichum salicis]
MDTIDKEDEDKAISDFSSTYNEGHAAPLIRTVEARQLSRGELYLAASSHMTSNSPVTAAATESQNGIEVSRFQDASARRIAVPSCAIAEGRDVIGEVTVRSTGRRKRATQAAGA